ncbi:MAG: elongation factor 1-beta [Thermoplasmata archaeon]|nr:elongation factor 1-beta [Thermoplasmata archaeon]
MGRVAITFNIMPETPDVDLDSVSKSIRDCMPEGAELKGMVVNPVAFGLNAIKILVIVGDKGGIADQVEKNLSELDGIQSVDVVETELV